ncbi:MAG: nitroreductase family protein [Bryobacteraceae bacterium]|nr:nitroreductase family protein [Bryobacteraceae bacterium]
MATQVQNQLQEAVELHPLIADRFSPRQFDPRPVGDEELQSLFQAARSSPSSYNEQPWSFLLFRRENEESFEKVLGTLAPSNAAWAAQAPVLLVAVAKREFTHNGRPNRHAQYDLGAAVANLTVQATALGLSVHQMAGFDAGRAREEFGIPETHEAVVAIAVGYSGATRPHRSRKPLSDFVFEGSWGARRSS